MRDGWYAVAVRYDGRAVAFRIRVLGGRVVDATGRGTWAIGFNAPVARAHLLYRGAVISRLEAHA